MSKESYDQPADLSARQSPPPDHVPEAVSMKTGDGGGLNPADEKDLWSGRPSWKHSVTSVLAWATFSVLVVIAALWILARSDNPAPGWAGWLIVALIVLPGLYVGCKILAKVYGVRYRVTSQRLFIDRGILARTTDQTELIRIDDVRVHKGLIDRIAGVGNVEVISTDATDAHVFLVGVETPDQIAEHIRDSMRILANAPST